MLVTERENPVVIGERPGPVAKLQERVRAQFINFSARPFHLDGGREIAHGVGVTAPGILGFRLREKRALLVRRALLGATGDQSKDEQRRRRPNHRLGHGASFSIVGRARGFSVARPQCYAEIASPRHAARHPPRLLSRPRRTFRAVSDLRRRVPQHRPQLRRDRTGSPCLCRPASTGRPDEGRQGGDLEREPSRMDRRVLGLPAGRRGPGADGLPHPGRHGAARAGQGATRSSYWWATRSNIRRRRVPDAVAIERNWTGT